METSESNKRKHDESSTSEEELQTKRPLLDEETLTLKLTDMPDQILLDIFKYLDARDLKALGFAHCRFSNVISDRTLWAKVKAGPDPIGPKRLQWMLTHGLSESTQTFRIDGFSKQIYGCHGYFHYKRPIFIYETEEEKNSRQKDKSYKFDPKQNRIMTQRHTQFDPDAEEMLYQRADVNGYNFVPSWPNFIQKKLPGSKKPVTKPFDDLRGCCGPRFTLTYPLLKTLCIQCPNLKELYLEDINFNHLTTNICDFPKMLSLMSLRGSKVFNMSHKEPMLSKIHIHLPKLEFLDLSECHWLEPDILMSLSKLENLRSLSLRCCSKFRDFVAYASLSTRHGFKNLRLLDYRGSPVGDSEVSPLGWAPQLTHVLLSPMSPRLIENRTHKHYKDDPIFVKEELHDWEMDIPPYYLKPSPEATEDKIPRPSPSTAPPPNWSNPKYQKKTKQTPPRPPIPISEDYYVTTGLDYERARLKEVHGVDFDNVILSDSDSSEDEVHIPYSTPQPLNEPSTSETQNNLNYDFNLPVDSTVARNVVTFNGENVRAYQLNNVSREELYNIMSRPPVPGQVNQRQIQCFRFNRELNTRTLITDHSVRYFGHAANLNIVHFDNRGNLVQGRAIELNTRPRVSTLRVLILRGYTRITDSSLFHLRTAAPFLQLLDVRDTGCTAAGLRAFRDARPSVKVLHSVNL